jgi:hypothetical protein
VTTVDGLAVLEAESPSALIDGSDPIPLAVMRDRLGASGGAYLASADGLGANATTWTTAAAAQYQVVLDRADVWTVWARRYAVDGNANQAQVAWGGTVHSSVDNLGTYGSWAWVPLASADLPAGQQLLELRRREDGYAVDQLVVAAGTWTPPSSGGVALPAGTMRGSAGTAPLVAWATLPAGLELAVDGSASSDPDRYDDIAAREWWIGNGQRAAGLAWNATYAAPSSVRITGSAMDLRGLRGASQWFSVPGFGQDQIGAMLPRSGRRVVAQAPSVGGLVMDGSTVTWTALPAVLAGSVQLMTHTADGTYGEAESYVLDLATPARIALAVSFQMMAVNKRPAWLDASWTIAGSASTTVDSRTILVRDHPAGRLSLGRNTAGRQYCVFVLPPPGGGG